MHVAPLARRVPPPARSAPPTPLRNFSDPQGSERPLKGGGGRPVPGPAPPNVPPVVSLTTPANNAVFAAPANITLNASASDSDGTIAKVEFFDGAALLATVLTTPYTFVWSNAPAGTHTLAARATDNYNATSTWNWEVHTSFLSE